MKRRDFFVAVTGAAFAPQMLRASAQTTLPSLRVLLGKGDVQPVPEGDGFQFGGRAYRGSFSQLPDGNIVNLVSVDDYLYSVVSREMPALWPVAALQLQAICSRTFALRRIDARKPYDVVPSELAQLYEGVGAETPQGRAAVDATTGLVLLYGTRYADAVYSSCCGGRTESGSDAWGGPVVPYLQSVACPYCTQSPNYRWFRDISFGDLADDVSGGIDSESDEIADVRLGPLDESGRVRSLLLLTGHGTMAIRGERFRLSVGSHDLPSLLIFRLSVDAGAAHFEGGGSGHGVGLCQWGARGMALSGRNPATIAAFYFPGTRIDTWTNASSPLTITGSRRS
jgi:stage II sporulation protein D